MTIKKTIAIASAKGGVGKSTVCSFLATVLSKDSKVGILDADIYGPNQDILFDINDKNIEVDKKNTDRPYIPKKVDNISLNSLGFLLDKNAAIWRGPMLSSAINQIYEKTNWDELDFLLIDMPPGTGDTQLTFAQEVKVDGAIIVSTPQDLALLDVKRGIQMFDKTGVKILGLIDNMSFFKGDDGKEYKIFGESNVEKTAKEFNKEFLGHLPIHQDLRSSADKGDPLTHSDPNHEVSKLFEKIAKKIKQSFL